MSLHHAANALNNEAIERLQMGQEDEALALFEKGWAAVTRAASVDSRPAAESDQPDTESNAQSSQTLPMAFLSPSVDSLSDTAPDESMDDSRGRTHEPVPQLDQPRSQALASDTEMPDFFIWSVPMDDFMDDDADEPLAKAPTAFAMFTRPFEFHVNEENDAFAWTSCRVMLPIVLSFNKGFAHHSMAVQEKAAVTAFSYRRALDCYTWSYQTLPRVAERGGYHELELNLLVVALLNNMAHCCAMLEDASRAWSCWDKLRRTWAATRHTFRVPVEERVFYDLRVSVGRRTTPQAPVTDVSSIRGLVAMRI